MNLRAAEGFSNEKQAAFQQPAFATIINEINYFFDLAVH